MSDLSIDTFSLDDIEDPFLDMEDETIKNNSYSQSGGSNALPGEEDMNTLPGEEDGNPEPEPEPEPEPTNSNESSIDPEELSPESVDPEELSPEDVNTNDEGDEEAPPVEEDAPPVENEAPPVEDEAPPVEDEAPPVEEEVPVDVPPESNNTSDLPSSEIILDDEDIIIDVDQEVQINDEEIIPEEKVISNEKDQSEDLFNEIMKMVPEKYRTNRTYIKRAQTLVKNCINLKRDVSKDEIDPTNIFKLNLKIKKLDSKPNLEKLMKLEFDKSHILPIVDDIKELYDIVEKDYVELLNGSLSEFNPEEGKFVGVDNSDKVVRSINLRNSYRKGPGRFNYSYNEEISRLHDMLLPYRVGKTDSNLLTRLQSDTRVFRNGFTRSPISYNKLKLEATNLPNHNVLKNDDISIVGFVKLPKDYLSLNQMSNVPLSTLITNKSSHLELFTKIKYQNIVENLKVDFDVGDTVLMNFSTEGANLVLNGTIQEFEAETNSIIVVPEDNDSESSSSKTLKVQLEDPSVDVINTTLSSRTTQSSENNQMKVFLFGETGDTAINDYRLRKYLMEIIPSTNNVLEVLRKKSRYEEFNYNILETVFNEYNVSIDDFIYPQLVDIMKILRDNISRDIKEAEKNDRNYIRHIKNPPTPSRVEINLVSDKSLKLVEKLYGPYPFYNLSKDSDSTRLRWLKSRVDRGEYYFRNIVKNIIDKFKFEPREIIEKIQQKKQKLEQDLYIIESEVNRMKSEIIYNGNKCPENRIVKIYNSYKDLEKDNERSDVEIDHDKLIYGEHDKTVKPGMFCVLDVDGKKKLFKRTSLDHSKDIWVLEAGVDADHLMDENRDFCEYQQQKINEIESHFFSYSNCSFNEIENSCVTKELDQKITEKYDLQNRISELDANIASLLIDTEQEPIQTTLDRLETMILETNKVRERQYQNLEKDKEEEKAKEVDPEYELLYKKIDLYLEKISKLESVERYSLLDILIQKYGREAIETNEPKENPMNVYCKYGNKVLCCSCDKRMVDIFKEGADFDEGLRTLVDDMGVEEDGMYWCRNCGREIHIAEYETTEGFKKNGARDITHEVVDGEDRGGERNTELFESLKTFLNAEDGGITTDNKLDIMKIYKAVLEQMGVKLSEDDELNLLKTVSGICITNIKPKVEWVTTYKGKPKHVDKAYNVYSVVNYVMYTVGYLFVLIQSSVPEYKITKMHQKCVPSLDGFPLSDSGDAGLDYFKCILENLMITKEEMTPLKKIKIDVTLKSTVTKLAQDDYIKARYKKKRQHLESHEETTKRAPPLNNWNEFRPPLVNYDINNSQIDSMNQKKMVSLKGIDLRNLKNYLSLKLISEIDKNVDKEAVENFLFNPALMGNSCCLSSVGESFNYMNFFLENEELRTIFTKLGYVFSNNSLSQNENTTVKTFNDDVYTYPSFKNMIFPSKEDIEESEITRLFETYISHGEFTGLKRIFYNDTCIFTNQKKSDILETTYTYEQYIELLKTIQTLNLENLQEYRKENKLTKKDNTESNSNSENDNSNKTSPEKVYEVETDINEINTLKNIITILSKNQVLGNDKYLNEFFSTLRGEKDVSKIADIWKDLTAQLKVIIEEIGEYVKESQGHEQGELIKDQLIKLGELRDIFADNQLSRDYGHAKKTGNEIKIKLIKKYLYSFLFNIPIKIKNDMGSQDIDPKQKPKNWNISQNYLSKLEDIVKSGNMICDKYILEKRSSGSQIIYDSLSSFINRNNKEIRKLTAKEHEYSCEGSVRIYSKCYNRNMARLLQYIFVTIFKGMLDVDLVIAQRINASINKTKKSPVVGTDVELGTKDMGKNDSEAENVVAELNMLEDSDSMINSATSKKGGKVVQMEEGQREHVTKLMIDIMNEIDRDRKFLDKHSRTKISENIEQKLESEKEDNLAIMKDLDKESRQSLTNMIKLGMTTWKNLSKKTDIDLHFGETIDEEGERDPANGDNDFLPLVAEEDMEENLQQRAATELGENYTSEEYDAWNQRRLTNEREDMEVARDADFMPDDDGDDYGMEAQGDDAYY